MNRLTIIGNLTKDPETRQTGNGKSVCNFTLAVSRREKDENGQNKADFFRVAAWGQMGENCQKYLTKGRKVAVVGTVSVRPYTDKDGKPAASMDVFAQEVEFLGSGKDGNGTGNHEPAQASDPAPAMASTAVPVDVDGELPF